MEIKKYRLGRQMPLGRWILRVIYDMQHDSSRRPSAAWRVYLSLFNKLSQEGSLINEPLSSMGDRSFKRLIRWLLSPKGGRGVNFDGTKKAFTAVLNRARKARLIRYIPDFPYSRFSPSRSKPLSASEFLAVGGNVASLTMEQWQRFLSLDLSEVRICAGPKMVFWKELYRDFFILLYELKSRPIDILLLHEDNIATDPVTGRQTCIYVPAKKKNQENAFVVQFISDRALKVIEKYRGLSGGGYILPLEVNRRRWNLVNAAQFAMHYRLAQGELWRINRFLRRAGERLSLPFTFTLYCVRRSAITHAIIEGRIPITILAKMAGTSVRMIEKHYTNYLHTLAEY